MHITKSPFDIPPIQYSNDHNFRRMGSEKQNFSNVNICMQSQNKNLFYVIDIDITIKRQNTSHYKHIV